MPVNIPYVCTLVPENYPIDGYTFGILGEPLSDGTYPIRKQGNNPNLSADYTGAGFVSDKEYLFWGSHPQFGEQIVRGIFDAMGSVHFLDDDPAASTSPTTLGGLPVLLGTPVAGQVGGVVDVNGVKVFSLINIDSVTALFDEIAKRGTDAQKGKTTQFMKLLGGLALGNIPTTDRPLPALVMDDADGKVYRSGVASLPTAVPVFIFGTHYEAVDAAPVFTVPTGTPPLLSNNKHSGSLDAGGCDSVEGWAKDRTSLEAIVQVDIYKNGSKHATVSANMLRADVATAIGPGTSPYCGFLYDVPASDRTGAAIVWSAFIAGTQVELSFSPKTSNVCGLSQTSVVRTYVDGPDELTEGGAAGQYVLKQELSDGSTRTIRPDSWLLGTIIPGISIDAMGLLTPGTGTSVINNTVTIGNRAILGSNSYEKPVRILNANPANPAPTVSPFPDTVVNTPGAQTFSVAGVFTDSDALTIIATGGTGEALPAGISFNASNLTITVAGDFPNSGLAIRLQATDTAGNVVQDSFLLTVARPVAPTRTLLSTAIVGSRYINEGATSQFRLRRTYSDNSVEDITNQAAKSLEGWRPGDNIDNEGNVSIPANSVQGDGHELIVVMNVAGTRYTFAAQVVDVSVPTAPAPVIAEMLIFHAVGWHSVVAGRTSENLHVLLRVTGSLGSATAQVRYNQSRNDASYRTMQAISYTNNPNNYPAGFTHWTDINDEDFSNTTRALNVFDARLSGLNGSGVSGHYLPQASLPDGTLVTIYPTT